MFILVLVLLILAGVCFLVASYRDGKWNPLALGLLLWVLVPICQMINSKV